MRWIGVGIVAWLAFAGNAGAAITVNSFDAGTLTVTSDAADPIAIACVGGNVEVNTVAPTNDPTCSNVVAIAINGGPGANEIDLTGTPASVFTSLDDITVVAGGGNDDFVVGDLGDVPITITGGVGADEITFNGSGAADLIFVGTAPASAVQIGGGAGATSVVATDDIEVATIGLGGGADVFTVDAGPDVLAGTVTGGAGDDQIMIADGGWTVDGGDGSEFYDITFGALGGVVTVNDTGAGGADFDSLSYSECDAIVDADSVTSGAEVVDYAGLELTPTCTSDPWPECGGGVTQECWSNFTVGGAAPHASLVLRVFQSSGLIQIQVQKIGNVYDLIAGGPLALTSLVGLTVNVGSLDPGIFIATGDLTSVTTTLNAVSGNTISVVMSPRASSWLGGGCTIDSCGDETTAATSDFAGILISAAGAPPPPPGLTADELAEFNAFVEASRGVWVATNAETFSTPYWDPELDAFMLELAAPHLKADGVTVNTGFFKAFATDLFLSDVFGLNPNTVSTGTFVVEKTVGGVTTEIPFAVTDQAGGVLIQAGTGAVVDGITLTPFEFSAPTFAVKKKPAAPAAAPAPTVQQGPTGPRVLTAPTDRTLFAGPESDTIEGGDGNHRVDAGDGDNSIELGDGANHVVAGAGNDTITLGNGNNIVEAGGGDNTILLGTGANIIRTGAGSDRVASGGGSDNVAVGAGNDAVNTGGGNDVLGLGAGNDVGLLGAGDDIAYGGAGADFLAGSDGNDRLYGGSGKDRIRGGAGDDFINANDGTAGDRVSCGLGRDIVIADPGDRIAADCEVVRRRS